MLDQLLATIFDKGQPSGISSDFLGNLSAEFIGAIVGAIISFAIALWLDRGRELGRQSDHRRRAATRWVDYLRQLFFDLDDASGRLTSGEDRAAFMRRRVHIVDTAIDNSKNIWKDYEDAFNKNAMKIAFDAYIESLENLKLIVGEVQVWNDRVVSASVESVGKLEHLVRTVVARSEVQIHKLAFQKMRDYLRAEPVEDHG